MLNQDSKWLPLISSFATWIYLTFCRPSWNFWRCISCWVFGDEFQPSLPTRSPSRVGGPPFWPADYRPWRPCTEQRKVLEPTQRRLKHVEASPSFWFWVFRWPETGNNGNDSWDFWTSTWTIRMELYEDNPPRGIRQHMEHTFEEAIRSEEEKGSGKLWDSPAQNVSTFGFLGSLRNVPQDISTMTVVQGLSKAAEKGAAKAEMKSKEVLHFWIMMEWIWIMDAECGISRMKSVEMFCTQLLLVKVKAWDESCSSLVEESWWWSLSHSLVLEWAVQFRSVSLQLEVLIVFFPECCGVGLCPQVKLYWIICVWMVDRRLDSRDEMTCIRLVFWH